VQRLAKTKSAGPFFIGLMSGTSADGIDAVLTGISGQARGLRARVVAHAHRPFAPDLRRKILRVCLQGTVAEICELNFLLGEHFAQAALAVLRKSGLRPRDVAAIGSHGQTIHHLPNAETPSTLQIGEPAVIAERTGIRTVADFRVRDMAAGGQGAPLVPFADWALFTDRRRPRIIQNIGGIANLTFLPAGGRLTEVMAFDTGPGNMIIDAVTTALSRGRRTFDRGGVAAGRGKISESLLRRLMAHPFLKLLPPKTTGREEFGEPFVQDVLRAARQQRLKPDDLLATVTAFTAASIADAYERFVFPKLAVAHRKRLQIVLGGGGARNVTLRGMLQERIGPGEILTHEAFGIDSSAKEALAFAIMAREALAGRPNNVPSATGASHPVIMGKVLN
jgi:anhydro-N-acetylmuramic acid kinase